MFESIGSGGEVKNLVLEKAGVIGDYSVGGLAGTNRGEIHRVELTGEVRAKGGVGGIVGSNSGTVNNSITEASVSGLEVVGGLVGRNNGNGVVESSRVTGNTRYGDPVLSGGDLLSTRGGTETVLTSFGNKDVWKSRGPRYGPCCTGGLAGANEGEINGSYVTGDVAGVRDVGGLVGNDEGNVRRSYTTGDVTGMISVGGLVGLGEGTVTESYSESVVFGGEMSGGLVGYNKGSVIDSYAAGGVGGGNYVGGLVGRNEGGVRYSRSESYVSKKQYGTAAGGLVGKLSSGSTLAHSRWEPVGDTNLSVVGETEEGEVVVENITPSYEPERVLRSSNETNTTNGTSDDTEELPGFSVLLSVIALLAVAVRHKSKD